MSKTYIVETDDETQLLVEIGVNSTGAALIATNPVSFLTPYTEPDTEKVRKEAYDKGKNDAYSTPVLKEEVDEAYQRGLKDAWECAKKISIMDSPTRDEIFGLVITSNIIDENSAPEAIEKIRQYEQEHEKIKVGDEVIGIYSSGEQTKPFVITKGNRDYYFGIYSHSGEFCQGGLKLQKTGRHFPEIAEVLKKMRRKRNDGKRSNRNIQ